jgi:hypothetical protein
MTLLGGVAARQGMEKTMRRFTLLLLVALLSGTDPGAAQETVETRGIASVIKIDEVLFGHLTELNGKFKLRATELTFNSVTSATTIAQTGTNISVGGIGDFNGDGTSDILMHQDVGTTRTDIVYKVVNNAVVSTHTIAVTGIDWHVA